jgi:hypothetical protein
MQQPDREDIVAGVDELAPSRYRNTQTRTVLIEATDVIFGLLSPEPYLVITPDEAGTQRRQRW